MHIPTIGGKYIVTGKGHGHAREMDKFIGKVIMVKALSHMTDERVFVTVKEDIYGWYFDTSILKPVTTSIR